MSRRFFVRETTLWMTVLSPGAQPRLKSWGGLSFGSQHRGACAPRPGWVLGAGGGCPPPAVGTQRYHPRKIFENWDDKFGILVTTCCEISCFFKYGQKVGGPIHCWSPILKVGGPVSSGSYGCCAYAWHLCSTKVSCASTTRGCPGSS